MPNKECVRLSSSRYQNCVSVRVEPRSVGCLFIPKCTAGRLLVCDSVAASPVLRDCDYSVAQAQVCAIGWDLWSALLAIERHLARALMGNYRTFRAVEGNPDV